MPRKQILIGLFAFIIYRTIGEPKKPQGGRERAFVDMCFLRPATAGTGILGVVFARPATAGTGANGLNKSPPQKWRRKCFGSNRIPLYGRDETGNVSVRCVESSEKNRPNEHTNSFKRHS